MSDSKQQFGSVTKGWLFNFMLTTAEGKAIALTFVPPIALFLLCLAGVVTKLQAVVAYATCLAIAQRLARGGKLPRRVDLSGKVAVVTGANTGIGTETVRELVLMGADRVFLCCRDTAKGEAAKASLAKTLGARGDAIVVRALDLASKASIDAFARKLEADKQDVHILINNAGVMMCPYSKTADGFEMQCGTNHLGHMYLVVQLLATLKRCNARIVTVSSIGHALYSLVPRISWADALSPSAQKYNQDVAYGHSKLANILFTRALNAKLVASGSGARAFCGHPGAVHTELGRHVSGFAALANAVGWLLLKTPNEGAQTQLYLAVDPNAQPMLYHHDCAVRESSPITYSDDSANELWAESCRLLGVQA